MGYTWSVQQGGKPMRSATDRPAGTGLYRSFRVSSFAVLVLLAAPGLVAAADERSDTARLQARKGQHAAPVTPFVIDVDLRDLPAPPAWRPGDPTREIPRRRYAAPGTVLPAPLELPDPLVELQAAYTPTRRDPQSVTIQTRNFAGISFTGASPPDTVGDVGPNHVIQATNGGGSLIRIWDKGEPTPAQLASFQLDSLGTGACANGRGDPIVIYDRPADRWVLLEFSGSGNDLCVYVSQTPDPVSGGWYAYSFVPPSFPDYPKLAVWPTDANGGAGSYVVTANADVAVYAMERGPMLSGEAAGFQLFNLPGLPGFAFEAVTPADIDGPDLPPATAPAVVMRHRDTEVHGGEADGDLLEMWAFDVDWADPGNSSITEIPAIDVADFSSDLCGLTSFSCFPQPFSATLLDPLREVIMHRLQYMNHDDGFETLAGNFVVDVSGTDHGGIRWFELRRTGGVAGSWALYQEGTYSIDSDNRWMAGGAMDQAGNFALAFNVTSTSTYPSLRYTGRTADDPLGVMTATETTVAAGSDSSGTNRYGDYSAMGLDPADDCTFWFTGEYNVASTWSTRWASFKYDTCGCLVEPAPPSLEATSDEDNRVDLAWNDSDLETVVAYRVRRSRTAGGPYETIAEIDDSSPGFAGGPGYSFADLDVSGGIEYFYVVVATDGGACRSDAANEVSVVPDGRCLLRPLFDGVVSAQAEISESCGIQLSWNPATPECGTRTLYNLYRSTDPVFVPGPDSLVAGGIDGGGTLDLNGLVSSTEYFYVVRAVDTSNFREDLNEVRVSAVAGGSGGENTLFSEDFEAPDALDGWTVTTGPGLHRCGEWALSTVDNRRPAGGSGQYVIANSYDCQPYLPATSASLDSPPIDLSDPLLAAVTVEFEIYYDHYTGDDATFEVWDGSDWVVLWTDPDNDVNTKLSFDVSPWALGNSEFQVRFNYQNAAADRWYSVDDVRIGVDFVCSAAPSPYPAPDGTGGTTPLRGSRLSGSGDQIEVSWDAASCSSGVYNLLYGNLADVSAYGLIGSECGIGGTGSFVWNGVPAGDLFFLVVGGDGVATESSWGLSSYGERNGLSPSGECGATAKTVNGSCPP
jgi:hypothetical protein